MKKNLVIGIVLVSVLLAIPFVFGEITEECTFYDRGIEYERCCPMDVEINCVSCRDTDDGKDYYTKGETSQRHWEYYESGTLISNIPYPLSDKCIGNITEGGRVSIDMHDRELTYIYSGGDNVLNVLRESYCEGIEYKYEDYACPNGCEDGACIRDDGCPKVIGWRIEGIKCFVDSGCNYDSSKYDYYDSAEECIKGLGKVEYPVLEPLPVPDICSDLLIEENIEGYNYRKTKYTRGGPNIYSKDGEKIGASKCCGAYYKKSIISLTSSIVLVCPYDNRNDVENSITWAAKEGRYELGEYMSQEVYWMRSNGNEALLWTNNNNIIGIVNEIGGTIPEDIAEAYIKEYNSDLGAVDVEIEEITPEPTTEQEPIEIGEPTYIPEEKIFYSCDGCEERGKCYPIGYRKEGQYCSDNNEFTGQSRVGICDNNFECKSNVCISDECVREGLIKKIVNWFKNLFK